MLRPDPYSTLTDATMLDYLSIKNVEMCGLEVYNNTALVGRGTGQAVGIHGQGVEASFQNNIFLAEGSVVLRVEGPEDKLRFETEE